MDPEETIVDRGVGDPDHLQRLWTPHRMTYIADAVKVGSASSAEPFTDIPNMSDEDGLILARGEHPSIDAVRIEMGNTGSKTTIHRYLKELDES